MTHGAGARSPADGGTVLWPTPLNERVAAMRKLLSAWADESGQDVAEYAILVGLVALAVIVALSLLGETMSDLLCEIGREMKKMSGEPPKSCIGKGKGL